jgi:hypothetical protein
MEGAYSLIHFEGKGNMFLQNSGFHLPDSRVITKKAKRRFLAVPYIVHNVLKTTAVRNKTDVYFKKPY